MGIKDIISMYVGKLFYVKEGVNEFYMIISMLGIDGKGFTCGDDSEGNWREIEILSDSVIVKPVLAHLSDISKQEKQKYRSMCKSIKDSNGSIVYIADTPESILYCLSKGYDVFDLIEKGRAIDVVEYQKR